MGWERRKRKHGNWSKEEMESREGTGDGVHVMGKGRGVVRKVMG